MRHIIWLGIRGLLLEFSGAILRIHGALHYRRLLSLKTAPVTIELHGLDRIKAKGKWR
jgi:hypothetical protein